MPAEWKAILDSLIKSATQNLGGIYGVAARYLLKYGGQALYDYGSSLYNHMKRAADQRDAKDKMNKVLANPESTEEEKRKAKDDWINS